MADSTGRQTPGASPEPESGAASKTTLERLLGTMTDIRPGEGTGVLLLGLEVFLLLFAYYLLKTARDSLILSEGGAVTKAYSSGGQALLLILVVPVYGYLGTKVNRIKLLVGMFTFFVSNLAIFYLLGMAGVQEGVAFFIWVGIFNVFVISQVWAFANDIYTSGQGKRLFPVIGIGASLGAWLGAEAAQSLADRLQLSPYHLQAIAAPLLGLCGLILIMVNLRVKREATPVASRTADKKLEAGDGFTMVFRSRYLTLIAVLIVLLNLVNTTGGFLLDSLVERQGLSLYPTDEAAQRLYFTSFYGGFYANVNLLGFLLQAFIVSRLFKFAGLRRSLYILPAIAVVSYSFLAFLPVLALVRLTKTLENATDYSLQNTLRQALFLPTSREAKYKAKAVIDTFFTRAGDVLQAGVVALGTSLQFAFTHFVWLNVGFTALWLIVVAALARQHRQIEEQAATGSSPGMPSVPPRPAAVGGRS